MIPINASQFGSAYKTIASMEVAMPGPIRTLLEKLTQWAASQRRLSNFTCGDCERWQRCGLPPEANCVPRAAQVARGDWKARRSSLLLGRNMLGW
jgi:hypothetical protein